MIVDILVDMYEKNLLYQDYECILIRGDYSSLKYPKVVVIEDDNENNSTEELQKCHLAEKNIYRILCNER